MAEKHLDDSDVVKTTTIPPEYQIHAKVFSEKEAERFPQVESGPSDSFEKGRTGHNKCQIILTAAKEPGCNPDMGPENVDKEFNPTIRLQIWTLYIHCPEERWDILNRPRLQTSQQIYGKRRHAATKHTRSNRRTRKQDPFLQIRHTRRI